MLEHLFTLDNTGYVKFEWYQEPPRWRTVMHGNSFVRIKLPWVQYAICTRLKTMLGGGVKLQHLKSPYLLVFGTHRPIAQPTDEVQTLSLPHMGNAGNHCLGEGNDAVDAGTHTLIEAFWMTKFVDDYINDSVIALRLSTPVRALVLPCVMADFRLGAGNTFHEIPRSPAMIEDMIFEDLNRISIELCYYQWIEKKFGRDEADLINFMRKQLHTGAHSYARICNRALKVNKNITPEQVARAATYCYTHPLTGNPRCPSRVYLNNE